jgi:hypothetical protein
MLASPHRRRPRLGDIFELATSGGLAYLQYVMKTPRFGALIRILGGTFADRPLSFSHLVRQPERFVTFFPLGAAVAQSVVTYVGHEHVPEWLRKFPLFRAAGNRDPRTGKVLDWWLWDGEKSWPIGDLRPEHRDLPIREVLNDTLLAERIADGWTPASYT